jgi:hypothetical protein
VLVIPPDRDRDVALIPPAPIVGLVTRDQDNRIATRAEREQRTHVAGPQLLHPVVPGALDLVRKRTAQVRTAIP